MFRAILLQVGVTIITALAAGLWVGTRGAVSAVLGGGVCVIPNLLFAWRLKLVAHRPGSSFAVNFLLGELVKMAVTIGLLVVVARGYSDLHWPSMLIGLALALQAMFLAFWKKN
jgi:ATP synthase protein I